MATIYVLGTVQYVPDTPTVLIPLQQVSPNASAPLIGCNAPQADLGTLTPTTLSDRTRWSDREVKAYATAFVQQNDPSAVVYTDAEWTAIQAKQATQPAPAPAPTGNVLTAAETIAATIPA